MRGRTSRVSTTQSAASDSASARPRRRPRAEAATREELAVELYTRLRLALPRLGVTPAQQRRAWKRAQTLPVPPRTSGRLLRETRNLGNLLLEWSRNPAYLNARGEPRVLAIRGPGASFETLANRFLPTLALDDIVARACADAEVATRPGGKIALLGGVLVNVVRSREVRLAHTVRQIDQFVQTILYNAAMHEKGQKTGRLERMVVGVIARRDLLAFIQELRPHIDELMNRVDTAAEPRQPTSARALKQATTVGLSVFLFQEDDWERAGIDALPLVRPKPPRPHP